jgi:hypothetical protein
MRSEKKRSAGHVMLALLLAILGAGVGRAEAKKAPVKKTQPAIAQMGITNQGLSVKVVALPTGAAISGTSGQGVMNFGAVSKAAPATANGIQKKRQSGGLKVTTNFGILVENSAGSTSPGTATVSAFLLYPDPDLELWVDGIKMSSTPQVIGRQLLVGAVSQHRLEIQISDERPPGPLNNLIGLMVSSN